MQNDLYFYIMLLGVILIGFALVSKRGSKGESHEINNHTVQLLSEIRQDMDRKMNELSRQIVELRTEMEQIQFSSSVKGVSDEEGNQHKLKLDQRYAEIFDLVSKGMSQEEIARTLDMGTGEVGMIIQLQKMTSTTPRKRDHGGSSYE